MDDELAVIVRAANERTESLCIDLLRTQTRAPLHVVHERPFVAALRKSLRLGIESGRTFTLCVDADIIMAPDAIRHLVSSARANPDAFIVNGYFLDKFYGEPKARGVHLYRTSALSEAEMVVPASDKIERPETAMKTVLVERGRKAIVLETYVLGLHGFGQYYRDIFRTMATRGRKSRGEVALLMNRFARMAGRDLDLRVALWGLVAGFEGEYSLDAQHWAARTEELLSLSQMSEKGKITGGEARKLTAFAMGVGKTQMSMWRRLKRFGVLRP